MYYRLTCNMDKYRNYYLKEEVKEGSEIYFETVLLFYNSFEIIGEAFENP